MASAVNDVIRLAGKAITEYSMVNNGDRILVGLSGGKDSLVLLSYLADRLAWIPITYTLVVGHINAGFEKLEEVELLKKFVGERGLEHYFENTDFARVAHSEVNRENPCFLCARLRRRRLFEMAEETGCSKIALGHHRDDLVETLLLNILFSGEIATMMPVQEFFNGILTIIRPLYMVPEDHLKKAAEIWKLPLVKNLCPSNGHSKRSEVKDIIHRLAEGNDKVMGNIFRSLSNYRTDYLLPRTPRKRRRFRKKNKIERNLRTGKETRLMSSEQRSRTRVNFKTAVTVISPDRKLERLGSRDLSLKGVFVETDARLPIGEEVDVHLELSGSTSLVSLSMTGHIARIADDGLAIEFKEIDMDSFFHLRNIIKYNTEDPMTVDEELATKPAF